MENLVKIEDEQMLVSNAWKVLYNALDERKRNVWNSKSELKENIQMCCVERVHEYLTGWTSYYEDSAKELQKCFNQNTREYPPISACKSFCKFIWDYTRKYKLSLSMEYVGDGSDARCYTGDDFERDCYNIFLRNNTKDLSGSSSVESNNLRQLLVYFGSRYLRRGGYNDGDVHDLQNVIVQFVGLTYKVAELQNWLNWLKSSSSTNVKLQAASVEDSRYEGDPLEEEYDGE